eukprot:TRINITY_DN79300_c0_g1_i1.p1 TRINITY_DN79300_c0_g1~~TRINITY_DN79300_c0_g1_i1.p1  ORF type:complete len:493 (-),score=111.27 TRINITY_DN79300_c0_g1_i1:23-1501(-)
MAFGIGPHTAQWITPRPGTKSLPSLSDRPAPVLQKDIRKPPDSVPAALKDLDYWKAMECFDIFDVFQKGALDKGLFHRLLSSACREEKMSRKRSDEMFEHVDLDGNGVIDKEEFLSWVFDTSSNYCGGVRKRLAKIQPYAVKEYYRVLDKDGSGAIDKEEFLRFIRKFSPDAGLSRSAIYELFDYIDKDKSGEIDVEEFLDWVHPDRQYLREKGSLNEKPDVYSLPEGQGALESVEENEHLDSPVQSPKTASPNTATLASKRPAGKSGVANVSQTGKAALFEMPPGKPVTLEFTVSKNFRYTLHDAKKTLRRQFHPSVLQFKTRTDDTLGEGCGKLVVLVGRGIVLWDQTKMLPYMENPFTDVDSTRDWITKVMIERLPALINAAKLKKRAKKGEEEKAEQRALVRARSTPALNTSESILEDVEEERALSPKESWAQVKADTPGLSPLGSLRPPMQLGTTPASSRPNTQSSSRTQTGTSRSRKSAIWAGIGS